MVSAILTVKTNELCRFTFFLIMHSFPKTGSLIKEPRIGKLYNSTELSVDWTSREFQNQTILFSRKIKSSI